jgi:hypothetical protein
MKALRGVWCLATLAVLALGTGTARAEATQSGNTVAEGPHRISGELGVFILGKSSDSPGPAFGAGYAYRALQGLEVGVGVRYLSIPGPTYYGGHMWLGAASLRGYLTLDSDDRLELGLTARAGLLALATKSGVCCGEVALAPDLRVWIARSTALALAPELAIGTTGNHNGPQTEDYVDEWFGQAAVWLSVVQTL